MSQSFETITREELMRRHPPPAPPSAVELAAFDLLLDCAQRDTGQSRRCANFLLAWWNAGANGGFDFTDLWSLDRKLREAALVVIGLVARWHYYPTSLPGDRGESVRSLVGLWRKSAED